MNTAKIVSITKPLIDGVETAEEFIAYAARVSNPSNQMNTETAPKLLKYLIKNKHWSPLEMIHITMEIETTRDIARQILRHRSFSFQEFSQRYADPIKDLGFTLREARLQDIKNRQNSIEIDKDKEYQSVNGPIFGSAILNMWKIKQDHARWAAQDAYEWAIENGVAKEQARAVLPEGLTLSRMYMAGSLRSWVHYCELRMSNGTQKEHQEVANTAWNEITQHFPSLKDCLNKE